MNYLGSFEILCRYLTPADEKCCQPENDKFFKSHDWEELLLLADSHLVTPSLFLGLQRKGLLNQLDQELCDHLKTIYHLNCERNAELKDQALDAIRLMNSKGIQPILLKGIAGLLTGLYEDEGERFISDIDLLIKQADLNTTLSVFTEHGYHCDQTILAAVSDHSFYKRELSLIPNKKGVLIDLHVRIGGSSGSNAFVSSEYALNQATPCSLDGVTALLPSPEFRLMHNFYHAQSQDRCFLNGSIHLRQLIDWVRLWRMNGADVSYDNISDKLDQHWQQHSFALYALNADRLLKQPTPAGVKINRFSELLYLRQKLLLQYSWFYKLNTLATFFLRAALIITPERLRLTFGDLPPSKLFILFLHNFLDPAWYKRRIDDLKHVILVLFTDKK